MGNILYKIREVEEDMKDKIKILQSKEALTEEEKRELAKLIKDLDQYNSGPLTNAVNICHG